MSFVFLLLFFVGGPLPPRPPPKAIEPQHCHGTIAFDHERGKSKGYKGNDAQGVGAQIASCPRSTRQRPKLARSRLLRKNLPRATSCDQPAQRREKMMNDGNKSAKLAHHSAIDSRIVRNAFVELALPHRERIGWFAPLQWGNWV